MLTCIKKNIKLGFAKGVYSKKFYVKYSVQYLTKEVVTSFEVLSRLVKWWPSVLIGCLKLKNSFLCFYSKLAVLSNNSSGTMMKIFTP